MSDMCPVCGESRVKRPTATGGGRYLKTCGKKSCAYELRGRNTRGNVYGDTGGGPEPSTDSKYNAVHSRARRALRGQPCAMADETCSGRLEVALYPDIPDELLRVDKDSGYGKYYPWLPVTDGYRLLCSSHHRREGNRNRLLEREPELMAADRVRKIRESHGECDQQGCETCLWFTQYDESVAWLLHVHVVPRLYGDGLKLPWSI